MGTTLLYKCYECKVRDIDPNILKEGEDYIRRGTHIYHKSCYNLREKRKKNPNIKDMESDDFWKDAAYDYLKKVVKIDVSTLFFKQWHDYLNQKGQPYTAKGIYFAILYFYDIKKGNKDKSNGGIGIIPYIYDESRVYWHERVLRQPEIIKQIENQIKESSERKKVVIYKQEQKRKPRFDLSSIAEMEDDDD